MVVVNKRVCLTATHWTGVWSVERGGENNTRKKWLDAWTTNKWKIL